MTIIRLAELKDTALVHEHRHRHSNESGRDGDLIFAPSEGPPEQSLEDLAKEKSAKWTKTTQEVGWEKCWIITDERTVFGELTLVHRPPLKSSLHRAHLMMGMERSHRGQGFGSKLMEAALTWAKAQKTIEWVQLYVFAHNLPAQRLYKKFGFQEVGRTVDMFRVHGQSIDDIEMTLKL